MSDESRPVPAPGDFSWMCVLLRLPVESDLYRRTLLKLTPAGLLAFSEVQEARRKNAEALRSTLAPIYLDIPPGVLPRELTGRLGEVCAEIEDEMMASAGQTSIARFYPTLLSLLWESFRAGARSAP